MRKLHEKDLAAGFGWVPLPGATGEEICECGQRVVVAVGVPLGTPVARSGQRQNCTTPHGGNGFAAGDETSGAAVKH
ncbi:MAG: hypothetical protein WDM80_06650 [Limisphaerales bacterium]